MCVRERFLLVLVFFAIFKAQAGCPFLPLSFGVWTSEPCECAALVNDISFFPYSICDYVRMHAHSSIVWMMAFPILFFISLHCYGLWFSRCLTVCQGVDVCTVNTLVFFYSLPGTGVSLCDTDTGHSLWSNIKRCHLFVDVIISMIEGICGIHWNGKRNCVGHLPDVINPMISNWSSSSFREFIFVEFYFRRSNDSKIKMSQPKSLERLIHFTFKQKNVAFVSHWILRDLSLFCLLLKEKETNRMSYSCGCCCCCLQNIFIYTLEFYVIKMAIKRRLMLVCFMPTSLPSNRSLFG